MGGTVPRSATRREDTENMAEEEEDQQFIACTAMKERRLTV